MKKVLLIGDSIRQGYDRFVKEAFSGEAEVYYPRENCRFTGYIMRNLTLWKGELGCGDDVDLVHWNAGLWDNLILLDGKHHTPLLQYRENIERISVFIGMLFPRAKVIFATSTPILEAETSDWVLRRLNADTEAYNAAACEAVRKYGATVNDLYALASQLPDSYHSDATHFYTEDGTRALAEQVICVIGEALGIVPRKLDYHALFSEGQKALGH